MDNDIVMMELVHDNFVNPQNAINDNKQHVEILFDKQFVYVYQLMVELLYMDLENRDLIKLLLMNQVHLQKKKKFYLIKEIMNIFTIRIF
jgi:hypothetical protein